MPQLVADQSVSLTAARPGPAFSPTGPSQWVSGTVTSCSPPGERAASQNREALLYNWATRRIFSLFPGQSLIKDILSAAIYVYLG